MSDLGERVKETMEEVELVLRSSLEGSSVLEDMGTRLVEAGGKRLRPELLVISYLAGGGKEIRRQPHRLLIGVDGLLDQPGCLASNRSEEV